MAAIFHGKKFCLSKTTANATELAALIAAHGGRVLAALTKAARIDFFVQSYNDDDDGRLAAAARVGALSVPPSFVRACAAAGALLPFVAFACGEYPCDGYEPPMWPAELRLGALDSVASAAFASREADELTQTVDEFAAMDRARVDARRRTLAVVALEWRAEAKPKRRGGKSVTADAAVTAATAVSATLVESARAVAAAHFGLETRTLAPLRLGRLERQVGLFTDDSFFPITARAAVAGEPPALDALGLIAVLTELRTDDCFATIALVNGPLFEAASEDDDDDDERRYSGSDADESGVLLGRATGDGAAVVSVPAHDSTSELLRTVAHEGSHILGLDHCALFACLMNANSVVGAPSTFALCPACERKLYLAIGFDCSTRTSAIAAALAAHA